MYKSINLLSSIFTIFAYFFVCIFALVNLVYSAEIVTEAPEEFLSGKTLIENAQNKSIHKTYDENTLTPKKLEVCEESSTVLKDKLQQLKRKAHTINTLKSERQNIKNTLSQINEQLSLNSNDVVLIKQYNEQVRRFNEKIKSVEDTVINYNQSVVAYNEQVNVFRDKCGQKSYYLEDADKN